MAVQKYVPIEFEKVEIMNRGTFKNFSGTPGRNNTTGQRYFNFYIKDEVQALDMIQDGFYVTEDRYGLEDGEPSRYRVKVIINPNSNYPPAIATVNKKGKIVEYDIKNYPDSINVLDRLNINWATVIANPSENSHDPGRYVLYLREFFGETETGESLVDRYKSDFEISPEYEDEELPFN